MKTRATIAKNATARTGRAAYAAETAQATAEEQAVSRSVDEQFPAVAGFLADEQAREHEDDQAEHEATRRLLLDGWKEINDAARARGTHTPALENFHNEVALLISVAPDPAATFDAILNAISNENAKNKATAVCPVYPGLCTSVEGEGGDAVDANGRHFDHSGRAITVPSAKCSEDPEIWAEFTHVSDSTACIGFMGADLTTGQARVKAQELRRFADEMDALADQVDTAVVAAEAGAR